MTTLTSLMNNEQDLSLQLYTTAIVPNCPLFKELVESYAVVKKGTKKVTISKDVASKFTTIQCIFQYR